jgi:hypothetical protein
LKWQRAAEQLKKQEDRNMESIAARTQTSPGASTALVMSVLLGSLGTSIVNIALPALVQTYSVPLAQVQPVIVLREPKLMLLRMEQP